MELKDRERSFDISKLTAADAERLSQQLGEKVREICDKACNEANRLLNIFGLSAQMQIVIDQKDKLTKKNNKESAPKRKRGRPKKHPNL